MTAGATGQIWPTALMSFALMVNLVPMATFSAVLPEITAAWGLSGSEAGWIGGIYFAGYAAAVPVLASLTDRIDGRWIFLGCTLVGAGACLAFAGVAEGVWTALVLRFIGGAALGGVHMPGLELPAERTSGRGRARGSADLYLLLCSRQPRDRLYRGRRRGGVRLARRVRGERPRAAARGRIGRAAAAARPRARRRRRSRSSCGRCSAIGR